MNKLKKILVLILTLSMLLSLSACGSFEMSLVKGAKNMAKLSSLHADAELSIKYGATVIGHDLETEIDLSASQDIEPSPLRFRGEASVEILGNEITAYDYGELTDGSMVIAVSRDGEEWNAERTDGVSTPSGGGIAAVAAGAAKYLSDFEKSDEALIIGGRETRRYDGTITGEELREILSITGAADKLRETMGENFSIGMIDESCSMPVSVWLCRKTGMILKAEADVTGLMQMFSGYILDELTGIGSDDLGIRESLLSIRLGGFDQMPPIQRPEI